MSKYFKWFKNNLLNNIDSCNDGLEKSYIIFVSMTKVMRSPTWIIQVKWISNNIQITEDIMNTSIFVDCWLLVNFKEDFDIFNIRCYELFQFVIIW